MLNLSVCLIRYGLEYWTQETRDINDTKKIFCSPRSSVTVPYGAGLFYGVWQGDRICVFVLKKQIAHIMFNLIQMPEKGNQ